VTTLTFASSIPRPNIREDRTRCAILSETLRLVEKLGFSKITLDDIARCLGKKKSFLNYYFPDKEALLAAAVGREVDAIRQELQRAVAKEVTGKSKISAYLLRYHQEIRRRLPMIRHLRKECKGGASGSYALILDKSRISREREVPMVADLLRVGVRDGSLRPLGETEIEAVAGFFLMALRGIEQEYILGEADETAEASFAIAIRTLECGLAP